MEKYSFAMARFGRLLARQKADVMLLDEKGIRLVNATGTLQEWPWADVRKFGWLHTNLNLSPMSSWLGNLTFAKREISVLVETAEGETEILLEYDAHYRKPEIRKMLRELYLLGVNVEERSRNEGLTFLLAPVSEEERIEQIKKLSADSDVS